jgi:hypothetical protein
MGKSKKFSVKKCYTRIVNQTEALNFRGKPWLLAIAGEGDYEYTVAEGSSIEAIHASLRAMHKEGMI